MSNSTDHLETTPDSIPEPRRHRPDADEGSLMSGAYTEQPDEEDAPGSPALSIAAIVLAVAAVMVGMFVNWILSVVLGVVAIIVGRRATVTHAPYPLATRIGTIAGIIWVIINTVLMVFYIYQLINLGLL